MSADWIKMQKSLPEKPEVWAIAAALNLDSDSVVGKLFRVWSWFDEHTQDGNAPSVTKFILDKAVGVNGFCDAMISACWMMEKKQRISLPNFGRHNGKTAKNRALTNERVAKSRNAASVTESEQKALPEKKREDINNNTKRKPVATQIPGGFALTDELITYAAKQGVTDRRVLEDFTESFINSCKAKPYLYADFNCAWKTWFRKRDQTGVKNGQTNHTPKPNAFDRAKQKLGEWERERERSTGSTVIDGQVVGTND
jgi:hypothetical protein